MASKAAKAWKRRERGVWRKRRFVERTSRTGKARRKEVENANVHFFFFSRVRKSWSQHFMHILPPGTFGELPRRWSSLDPAHDARRSRRGDDFVALRRTRNANGAR
jgi:hypothetical protein